MWASITYGDHCVIVVNFNTKLFQYTLITWILFEDLFIDAFYTQILNKDRRYFFRKWRIPERCHIKVSARKPLQKALFLHNVLKSFLKENLFFLLLSFFKICLNIAILLNIKKFFWKIMVKILYKKVFYSIMPSEAFPSRR